MDMDLLQFVHEHTPVIFPVHAQGHPLQCSQRWWQLVTCACWNFDLFDWDCSQGKLYFESFSHEVNLGHQWTGLTANNPVF